jgi:hypothetical protein
LTLLLQLLLSPLLLVVWGRHRLLLLPLLYG